MNSARYFVPHDPPTGTEWVGLFINRVEQGAKNYPVATSDRDKQVRLENVFS